MLPHRSGFLIHDQLSWLICICGEAIHHRRNLWQRKHCIYGPGRKRETRKRGLSLLEHCPRDRVYSVDLTSSSPNSITQGPKTIAYESLGVGGHSKHK